MSGHRYDPPVPEFSTQEFLTPEWVAELDALARTATRRPSGPEGSTADPEAPGRLVTVELHVTDGAGGEFVFQVAFSGSTLRFVPGAPAEPDLLVTVDHRFAERIHRGDASAQDALAAGALKVRGDLELVGASAPALSALGEAFARARGTPDA